MNIKPVAWSYQHKEDTEIVYMTDTRSNSETRNPLYEEVPLYALPATHRMVPVELLESAVIATYLSCPEISLQLGAIIDKEPTT
jgi:hypothetical protein